MWHWGVGGQRKRVLVPVLLGIPLVDMRRRTGWVEGDPTTNQCVVMEVSEGVTTGVSANLDKRGSVPRAAAHCSAAHWTCVAWCWMSASAHEKLAGCGRFPMKNKRIPLKWKLAKLVLTAVKVLLLFWSIVMIWETNSLEEKIQEKLVSSFHKLKEKRNPNLLCPMSKVVP